MTYVMPRPSASIFPIAQRALQVSAVHVGDAKVWTLFLPRHLSPYSAGQPGQALRSSEPLSSAVCRRSKRGPQNEVGALSQGSTHAKRPGGEERGAH